jgi:hypothetical protein
MPDGYLEEIPHFLKLPFETALNGTYLFITAALAANLLLAFILNNPFISSREKHLGVFSPIVLWISIVAWGVLMRNKAGIADAPSWPVNVLHLLLFLNLPTAGFAALFAEGHRYYALSICAFLIWMNYCAYEVALKVVTGVWG